MVTATAVFAAPAPSMAAGDDYFYECGKSHVSCQTGLYLTTGSGSFGNECGTADYGNTRVCVRYDGDYVYVYDGSSDGNSAMAWILSSDGSVTSRYCRNPHGYNTWAKCDFNWAETGSTDAYGGYRVTDYSMKLHYLFSY